MAKGDSGLGGSEKTISFTAPNEKATRKQLAEAAKKKNSDSSTKINVSPQAFGLLLRKTTETKKATIKTKTKYHRIEMRGNNGWDF